MTVDPALAEPSLAWERRDQLGLLRGLIGTAAEFLISPRAAAGRMRKGAGLGDPLLFAVLTGSIGILVTLVTLAALASQAPSSGGLEPEAREALERTGWGWALLGAALAPLWVTVHLFLGAFLLHLALVLVGGERQGFEATFRALAYASGAGGVVACLPVCGAPLGWLWAIVATGLALGGAHGVSSLRAMAAALLPLVLALVCCGGLSALFLGLGALGAAAGG